MSRFSNQSSGGTDRFNNQNSITSLTGLQDIQSVQGSFQNLQCESIQSTTGTFDNLECSSIEASTGTISNLTSSSGLFTELNTTTFQASQANIAQIETSDVNTDQLTTVTLQASTNITTPTLNATTNVTTPTLNATTSVTTPTLNVTNFNTTNFTQGNFIGNGTFTVNSTLADIKSNAIIGGTCQTIGDLIVPRIFINNSQFVIRSNKAIAIGFDAGQGGFQQNANGIAFGEQAGYNNQGVHSIAIGSFTGNNTQGNNSIAIGYYAGSSSQHARTIVLNASGSTTTNSDRTDACFINPIRLANATTSSYGLGYNRVTKEISTVNMKLYTFNFATSTGYTAGVGTNLRINFFGTLHSFYARINIHISTPTNNGDNGGFRRFEMYRQSIFSGGGVQNVFNDYTAGNTVSWSSLSISASSNNVTVNTNYSASVSPAYYTYIYVEFFGTWDNIGSNCQVIDNSGTYTPSNSN
jgi:hypothetical protein